jgi:ActR/RegA family two-component response regulator
MPLECLLLTEDATLLSAIRAQFAEFDLALIMRKNAASAIELSKRRHLDGFVIDCDDASGGAEVLGNIRRNHANKRSVILAVLNGTTSISQAFEMGANFVLGKPVQEERIAAVLDMVVPKMKSEHRRYFRYESDLPVEFRLHTGERFPARMLNISEGGIAIHVTEPLSEGAGIVQFYLPSIEAKSFKARAIVAWATESVAGLQFLYVEPQCRVGFQAWLNSLEAHLQFRNPGARLVQQ